MKDFLKSSNWTTLHKGRIPFHDSQKRSIVLSQTLILAIVAIVPFFILTLFDKLYYASLGCFYLMSAAALGYYFNEKKSSNLSRRLVIILFNIGFLLLSSMFDRKMGVIFFFVPLILVTFIVYGAKKWSEAFYLSILSLTCILILELNNYTILGIKYEPAHTKIFQIAILLTVIAFVMISSIFMLNINRITDLQRKKRQADLARINEELEVFSYKVSHDLKAPLASIRGLVNVANLEVSDPLSRDYFSMIESRVKDLESFILELLDQTRIGKKVSSLTSLEKSIHDVIDQLKFMDGFSDLDINVIVKETQGIQFEKRTIELIFKNLISNAIQFRDVTKNQPQIRIVAEEQDNFTRFVISDNGIGIPKESQTQIFEKYYKSSSNPSSTGIGLYLLKKEVEKINGIIIVDSEIGQGTIFTITIPKHSTIEDLAETSLNLN